MHQLVESAAVRTAAALLALGVCAACHALQAVPANPPAAALEEAQDEPNLPAPDLGLEADLAILRRLERAFDTPTAFDDAPVSDVLDLVAKETGLRVLPDRHVLADGGGWKLKTVTCAPITPRDALDAVLRSLGEGLDSVRLDVASGVLVFTDADGMRALRAKRIYRVGDLLRAMSTVTGGREIAGDPDGAMRIISGEVLADLLFQSVIPDDWAANGGDLAHASIVGELLVVTATPASHLAIERTLDEFRTGAPVEPVLWTITLREIPNDVDPAIERRLIAIGAEERDSDTDLPGEIVSRPVLLAQPTEPASIEIGNDTERWKIEIAPYCDAGRCTYAITAERSSGAGDARRSTRATMHAAVGAPAASVFTVGEGAASKRFVLHAIGNRRSLATKLAPKEE